MDLEKLMQTNGTCRFYKTDPVPEALIADVLDAARWAPSGGNRQPLRFIVVRDTEAKSWLKALYLPIWDAYIGGTRGDALLDRHMKKVIDNANHFARHLDEIPILLLVCARLADVHPTDHELGRLSIVGGASVYPAVQNVLLAARAAGLGTALTTLHCALEPQIKVRFKIPEDISLAAVVAMGWPARSFPKQLHRRPLAEISFDNEYGKPFIVADWAAPEGK